jgi:hypothetical protein
VSLNTLAQYQQTHFSLLQNANTGSGAHPPSYSMGSFLGLKRPGRGADHLSTSSAEGNNDWSHTSVPPICLHSVDNFTFLSTCEACLKDIQCSQFAWLSARRPAYVTSYCQHHKHTIIMKPTAHLYWMMLTSMTFIRLHGMMLSAGQRGTVGCCSQQSQCLHSSLNTACIQIEMMLLNELPINVLSLC